MTIIPRKVYEPGGFAYIFTDGKCKPLAANIAYLKSDFSGSFKPVTWDELMSDRRDRQQVRLDRILQPATPSILPCYVWTFFNAQDIPYHGWFCYVMTRDRDCQIAVNFRGFKDELAASIMREIPLGLLPVKENFVVWMAEFAKQFPRKKNRFDPRKSGTRVGWLKDRSQFTLERPQAHD